MATVKILVIEGTTRKGRRSIRAANYVVEVGNQREGVEVSLADPTELKFELDGHNPETRNQTYAQLTKDADAFIIVTPEYNNSFPGSLKRMLDSEYANYKNKPAAIVGVSTGRFGGVRAMASLLPALRKMGMLVIHAEAPIGNIKEAFDDSGQPTEEYIVDSVNRIYDEIILLARVLKQVQN